MQKVHSFAQFGVRLVREADVDVYGVAGDAVAGPREVYKVGQAVFDGLDREAFAVVLLNARHNVIGVNTVSVGVLDGAVVHPREVFKPAILASAAALVLVHNHPSGDPTPSPEDKSVTRQIVQAGQVLGIPVLDHVVCGHERYFSFQENGLLD